MLCFHLIVTSEQVSAQEKQPPIEKAGLIKSLQNQLAPIERLTSELNTYGVAFALTPAIEIEIRREGHYLGKRDLDKLIEVIRSNYPPKRLRVSLFKYEQCEKDYDQFARLLFSKVITLPSLLIAKDSRSSYTAGLNLVKEEKPFSMSLLEANQYLEKTQSLQVLHGICKSSGKEVYVTSQVILGNASGLLSPTILIEFRVDDAEFGRTRDIHSVLILYSLARDAQVRGVSKDLIIEYLSEARGLAAQIEPSDSTTLQSIKRAIEGMLGELGASNLAVLPTK